MKNRNTSRKTEYDLKLIKNYFVFIGEIRNVDGIPQVLTVELDLCLVKYFLNIRKVDKSEYDPDTHVLLYECNCVICQVKNYSKGLCK